MPEKECCHFEDAVNSLTVKFNRKMRKTTKITDLYLRDTAKVSFRCAF